MPGDALSLVVIDKLPFAPPDDPLLAARLDRLKDQGGNPFMAWQLPQVPQAPCSVGFSHSQARVMAIARSYWPRPEGP